MTNLTNLANRISQLSGLLAEKRANGTQEEIEEIEVELANLQEQMDDMAEDEYAERGHKGYR